MILITELPETLRTNLPVISYAFRKYSNERLNKNLIEDNLFKNFLKKFNKQKIPLGDLIEKGIYLPYNIINNGSEVEIKTIDGRSAYGGIHDSIEGIFKPDNSADYIFRRFNENVTKEPLIAFKDDKIIKVYSAGGKVEYNLGFAKKPLFGGSFDEIHPLDIFVSFIHENIYCTNPEIVNTQPSRFVLGKRKNDWVLTDILGNLEIKHQSKEVLQNTALGVKHGDNLILYYDKQLLTAENK